MTAEQGSLSDYVPPLQPRQMAVPKAKLSAPSATAPSSVNLSSQAYPRKRSGQLFNPGAAGNVVRSHRYETEGGEQGTFQTRFTPRPEEPEHSADYKAATGQHPSDTREVRSVLQHPGQGQLFDPENPPTLGPRPTLPPGMPARPSQPPPRGLSGHRPAPQPEPSALQDRQFGAHGNSRVGRMTNEQLVKAHKRTANAHSIRKAAGPGGIAHFAEMAKGQHNANTHSPYRAELERRARGEQAAARQAARRK